MLSYNAILWARLFRILYKIRDRDLNITHQYLQEIGGETLDILRDLCGELGLTFTALYVERLLARIHGQDPELIVEWSVAVRILEERLEDELAPRLFLYVPADLGSYYQTPMLFDQEVNDRFPSAATEIENAGKCFALGQNTACVFHLMRVLERGLSALANDLNVPFANQNWGNIIEQLEASIKAIGATPTANRPPDWKERERFYSEAAVQFRYIKNAWRNHVMHTREHYDAQQARHIFDHVREFMRHLATRLSEQPAIPQTALAAPLFPP